MLASVGSEFTSDAVPAISRHFWTSSLTPSLRGLVDVYDGARHIFQCLIVASTVENGEIVCEFKRSTAVRAAKRMGLNVCGVDMLRSNHGPVIMEVNSSPGLEGIESATGKDIAGQIIDFIAANAKGGATKTKGRG